MTGVLKVRTGPTTWAVVGGAGPKGDTGVKGDKGDQGDQGTQGVQGVPGSLGIVPFTTVTAASYTLQLTDGGSLIYMSSATAQTLIVPLNSVVAFPLGTQIHLVMGGAGRTTVQGATGAVSINTSTPTASLRAINSMATLFKFNTDYWILGGDTL